MNIKGNFADKGYKITKQRSDIIKVLAVSKHCMTAEEIFFEVKKLNPSTNLSTIYRTVDLLCKKGLLNKLNFGDNKYRYQAVSDRHSHHAICLNCKRTMELKECPVQELERKVCRDGSFKVTGHKLEVYGYCSQCQTS